MSEMAARLGLDPLELRLHNAVVEGERAGRGLAWGCASASRPRGDVMRGIHTVGAAVKAAAEDARRQLLAVAADPLEAAADDLEIADGHVQVRDVPDRCVAIGGVAQGDIDVRLVEVPAEHAPFGARGVGEPPVIAAAAAIANAVADATGVWFGSLPITSDAIVQATAARDTGSWPAAA